MKYWINWIVREDIKKLQRNKTKQNKEKVNKPKMKIVYITKKKMWNIIRLHKRKLLPGSQQGNAVERQFKAAEWENPDLTFSRRHTAFYSCIWKNSL